MQRRNEKINAIHSIVYERWIIVCISKRLRTAARDLTRYEILLLQQFLIKLNK